MKDCLFCKLINREIEPKFIFENDVVVAFYDIHPRADIHILIVPKKHIDGFLDISNDDQESIMEMIKVAQNLTNEHKSAKIGYRMVFNGGKYQEVPHLHWHLLGDRT
jgi:histidine triad (HIT) family protein